MEKKKKQMPNTIIIILGIVIVACLMTYIIPAGEYVRIENADGVKVIDPLQFSYIERSPVNPLLIPNYVVAGFKKQLDIFLLILFSGGVFQFINTSGALHSFVAKVVKKYSDKAWIFITILSLVFCLLCFS